MTTALLRNALLATAAVLLAPVAAHAADSSSIRVCSSLQEARAPVQAQGSSANCRTITVDRTGDMCVIDLNPHSTGVLGSIVDATATTQWWTNCANIAPPR